MRNAALILIAFSCFAQSQPPVPGQSKATKNDHKSACCQQNVRSDTDGDSNALATAINQLASQVKAGNDQRATEQKNNNTSSEGWAKCSTIATAVATVAIAILGIFQWLAMNKQRSAMERQASCMNDALAETKKSADAAAQSADVAHKTLEISQRAIIRIDRLHLLYTTGGSKDVFFNSKVQLVIANAGLSTAKKFYFSIAMFIAGANELGHSPGAVVSTPQDLTPGSIRGRLTEVLQEYFDRFCLQQVDEGKRTMWVAGFVRYSDIFGHDWRIEYNGKFDPASKQFDIATVEKPDSEPHQWPPAFD